MGFFGKVISAQLPVSEKKSEELVCTDVFGTTTTKRQRWQMCSDWECLEALTLCCLVLVFSKLKKYPTHINIPGARFFFLFLCFFFSCLCFNFFFLPPPPTCLRNTKGRPLPKHCELQRAFWRCKVFFIL